MPCTFDQVCANPAIRQLESLYVTFAGCEKFGGTRAVNFWYQDHVLVDGSYADDDRWERAVPYDIDGNCLIKIPAADVRSVLTEAEAEQVDACNAADERLMSYAR